VTERSSRWGVVVLIVVMTGLAGWLVASSPVFATREVRVIGNLRLTAEQVRALAGVELGDNTLRLGADRAADALERHPWIARASVSPDLPSTVLIRVEERRPAAWLRDPGGIILVAPDGTVLDRVQSPDPSVPFAGRWPEILAPGRRVQATGGLRVAAGFPLELRPRVRRIGLRDGVVEVELRGGVEVRYGRPSGLEAKHRALVSLLGWARDRNVRPTVIDLRYPETPTIVPARSSG
jgi:cell division protein FtsQ